MAIMERIKNLSDDQLFDGIGEISRKGSSAIEQIVLFGMLKEYESRHGDDALDQLIEDNEIRPIVMERSVDAGPKAKVFLHGGMAKADDGDGVWRSTEDGGKIFIEGDGDVKAGGPEGKKLNADSGGRSFRIKADATPESFVSAANSFRESRPDRRVFLSELGTKDIEGSQVLLADDGDSGAVVSRDGDIQNVFNGGRTKGAGKEIMIEAVKRGGKTLDCFDSFLPRYYEQFGFTEVARMKFNREYAPEGWDYESDGEPDVVFMARTKDVSEEEMRNGKPRQKDEYERSAKTDRYSDDWDDSKARSREVSGTRAKVWRDGTAGQPRGKAGSIGRGTALRGLDKGFCPTGEGGGVDNSCGSGDGEGKSEESSRPGNGSKESKSTQRFESAMNGKSKEDVAVFRKARKDGVAIPPMWTGVVYHGKSKDVIAEGRDAAGRKQRVENPAFRQGVSDKNNARISKDLAPRMSKIRSTLRKDAAAGNEESKVLYLISQTGFRIGGKGDGKSKSEAFGASTLLGKHVKVSGDTVEFDFPGKKGVRQNHVVKDKLVASWMRGVGKDEPIFKTRAEKVRESWKSYGGEKVHDIRHVVATEKAKEALSSMVPPYPKSERERKRIINAVGDVASKKIGNNRSEAINTYIDPAIWKKVKVV